MKIYKFGGASVKDADGVRNVTEIIKSQRSDHCLLVVSAMGKMTNAFEEVVFEIIHRRERHNNELTAVDMAEFNLA